MWKAPQSQLWNDVQRAPGGVLGTRWPKLAWLCGQGWCPWRDLAASLVRLGAWYVDLEAGTAPSAAEAFLSLELELASEGGGGLGGPLIRPKLLCCPGTST